MSGGSQPNATPAAGTQARAPPGFGRGYCETSVSDPGPRAHTRSN